ncbi:MAG: hypothetical protein Q9192_006778 [Flavoplaca navasiana]
MKRVAMRCGLGAGTLYVWRNKASTKVAWAIGPDKARLFMNLCSNSKTFEKDYNEAEYDLHVTAIALSEDHLAGAQSLRDDSSPALFHAPVPLDHERPLTVADAEEEWSGFEDDEGPIAVDMEGQLGLECFIVCEAVHNNNTDNDSSTGRSLPPAYQ